MNTVNEYRINYESLDEKRVIADTMESALRLALKELEEEPKSITCVQKKVAYAKATDPATIRTEARTEEGATVLGASVAPERLTDVKQGDTVYFQYGVNEDVTLYTFDHWEINGEKAGTETTLRLEVNDEKTEYVVSAVFLDHTADVDAPKNVKNTEKTSSSLLFEWEGELPEDGYYEYTLALAETGDAIVNAEHTQLRSIEIEQLDSDEAYKFTVCAKDKWGNASAVVTLYASTDKEPPLPVANLQATNITADSADITFEAPISMVEGFQYSLDVGTTWTDASASPIQLTGLTEDTEYAVYVVTILDGLRSAARRVAFTTLAS